MTQKNIVILFRGRNTEGVFQDACKAGLVPDGAEIITIAHENDALAQPSDVTVDKCLWDIRTGNTVVIANGGTTAQLVPVIAFFARHEGSDDAWTEREWTWSAWDVQRDGVTQLAGDPFKKPCN